MNYRARILASLTGIALVSSMYAPATAAQDESKRTVLPPSLSKLSQPLVFAPLPDGRMIGVFFGSQGSSPAAMARYSTDGGRTWSEQPEMLCTLSKDLGGWGLHNVLVDHKGELHLICTNDANANTPGRSLYEMRFDVYHIGSADGRKTWK